MKTNIESGGTRDFIFGLIAVADDNNRVFYLSNRAKYPVMLDVDRKRLGDALLPVPNSVGDREKVTVWWARYTELRQINNWMVPSTLLKIAYANGVSGAPSDLVSGKPIDNFIIELFQAAKAAISTSPDLGSIRPAAG
jgi:hypothetical protein